MMKRKKPLRELFNKQSGLCGYCEKDMNYNAIYTHDAPTLDHILPRAVGGKTQRHNLICVCYECNQKKADMPLVDFLLKLRSG
jgi:5-methylcytosine-specific restriction endonuclease McrA